MPKEISGEIIKKNVIIHMKTKGIKTVSINSRLRALIAFFNLLETQKYFINYSKGNQSALLEQGSLNYSLELREYVYP
jgi:hypothetical protein